MVTQRNYNIHVLTLIFPLFLSGCIFGENKQFFESEAAKALQASSLGGTSTGDPSTTNPGDPSSTSSGGSSAGSSGSLSGGSSGTSPGASPTATPAHTALATETFSAANTQVKKIDFLFVVDNSGSMADNQAKLAAGFETFANAFYQRADLDICTLVITTDRYLGRIGAAGYSRERSIPCTKPAGSNGWTNVQMQAHIVDVIADFRNAVDVGTHGSGTELSGKSLAAFLTESGSTFFRSDAVANISFITDENNWFFNNEFQPENTNDLPAIQNAAIFNSATGRLDNRLGIKNTLDSFFVGIRPNVGLSYSVTTFLELTQPATTVPGVAMNLLPLSDLIGRESSKADIEGAASDYTNVYQSISSGLVDRASAFQLTHDLDEPTYPTLSDLSVKLVSLSGSSITLSASSDYSVIFPNGIVLNPAIANTTIAGDRVTVSYRYITP